MHTPTSSKYARARSGLHSLRLPRLSLGVVKTAVTACHLMAVPQLILSAGHPHVCDIDIGNHTGCFCGRRPFIRHKRPEMRTSSRPCLPVHAVDHGLLGRQCCQNRFDRSKNTRTRPHIRDLQSNFQHAEFGLEVLVRRRLSFLRLRFFGRHSHCQHSRSQIRPLAEVMNNFF